MLNEWHSSSTVWSTYVLHELQEQNVSPSSGGISKCNSLAGEIKDPNQKELEDTCVYWQDVMIGYKIKRNK